MSNPVPDDASGSADLAVDAVWVLVPLIASKSSFLRFEAASVLYLLEVPAVSLPGESLDPTPPAPGGGDADFFYGTAYD